MQKGAHVRLYFIEVRAHGLALGILGGSELLNRGLDIAVLELLEPGLQLRHQGKLSRHFGRQLDLRRGNVILGQQRGNIRSGYLREMLNGGLRIRPEGLQKLVLLLPDIHQFMNGLRRPHSELPHLPGEGRQHLRNFIKFFLRGGEFLGFLPYAVAVFLFPKQPGILNRVRRNRNMEP